MSHRVRTIDRPWERGQRGGKVHQESGMRNIYPPEEMQKHGFAYTGVGRGS